jgi:class 3 adenylate cyclase
MQSVLETNRFVSTLFPANVRDRVMNDANDPFLTSGEEMGAYAYQTRPIADYFPHTTVMFADISGFTAWSSTREPFQVFQLLETLYGAFDEIAKRRRVFKVETVGDSYVAVCGLPLPRKDHAVVMARFARDCTNKANDTTRRLEVTLGPDTADLAFRIGLHSGPVTGGVLRGKNARFQLFGDTMNTASRMESTGTRNRVQVSTKTAEVLIAAGKSHWVTPRGESVTVKGKGQMETFWLTVKSDGTASETSGSRVESDSTDNDDVSVDGGGPSNDLKSARVENLSLKDMRLIDWNVAVLSDPLKAVIKQRNSVENAESSSNDIEPEVVLQLKSYVTGIATMYRDNPFHSFEHASHVTMSVTKLLSRVVTTDDVTENQGHGFTNTIASDALTHLAAVFSALVHDVDHTGLPNARLVADQTPVAIMYDNKSVAEKNSIAIAWEFLLRPEFSELRACIGDIERFHDLVTDAVMATDIADKDLKEERNARWATVFTECESAHPPVGNANQLKATIVLDHLMQAADVSHTMQHWHIYRKWNERLFQETWKAYKAGHAETNPVDTWYKGELGFFDFYVIPLAKKLNECGVFGVSSDEHLEYALENRREWELKGQEVVAMLVHKYCGDVPYEEKE